MSSKAATFGDINKILFKHLQVLAGSHSKDNNLTASMCQTAATIQNIRTVAGGSTPLWEDEEANGL